MNVESWMKTLAAQEEDGRALPDAAVIYWRAELRRRAELRERLLGPAQWMNWVASAAFLAMGSAFYL